MSKIHNNYENKPQVHRTGAGFLFLIALLLLHIFMPTRASALDSLCAEVKIEIVQELALERQAFDAHMRINNGLDTIALEDVAVTVTFTDADGNPVVASSDASNEDATFFIRLDTMDGISDVSGSGTVAPSSSADIHWLIIPAPGASNGAKNGTLYYVGATLTYTINGIANITEVTPDYIYVKPMPELVLDYFLPRDVYGDDAFTPEIEPPVPFSFGVRVKNTGFGTARNLKIDSAQPKIVENRQNLLVNFVIEASQVNAHEVIPTLMVDFGDIEPEGASVARWIMTTTLCGEFVDFRARFSHSDELGGKLTSLIQETRTHELVNDVLVDLPGRDMVADFLVKEQDGYKVYESSGNDFDVNDLSSTASLTPEDGNSYSLSSDAAEGFSFIRVADPMQGAMVIDEIIRSDGKHLKPENVWLSRHRDEDNNWHYYFNIFDTDTTGEYTVRFANPPVGEGIPVLQFIPDKTTAETNTLAFMVQASSPSGVPELSVQMLPAGARFTDNGDGTGMFRWTPAIGQAGIYSLKFVASANGKSARQRMTIRVFSEDDSDGDGMADEWEREHFGNLDRDGTADFDNDGITDKDEFLNNTNPASGNFPPVPSLVAPASGAEVATLTPELAVHLQTEEGADAPALKCIFEIFRKGAPARILACSEEIEVQDGNASWQVPQDILKENTWYEWRVRSTDGSGYSIYAYGTFFTNTQNDAPSVPRLISPSIGMEVSSNTPILMASLSSDPDGDSINYIFTVFDTYTLENVVASGPGVVNHEKHTVSWQVTDALSEGQLYYWQVRAVDEHGAEAISLFPFFSVNAAGIVPPSSPVVLSPADSSLVTQSSATLQVSIASDNSTLAAIFEIDTLPTFDSDDLISSLEVAVTDGVASWSVEGLKENTTYYWRARVGDGRVESPWSAASFFVNMVNDPPPQPVVRNPADVAWVNGIAPSLELFSIADPDGDNVTWIFEIYEDSAMSQEVSTQELNVPVMNIAADAGLEEYTWYYWRAKAVDSNGRESAWTPLAGFFTTAAQAEEEFPMDTDGDGDVDGLDIANIATSHTVHNIGKVASMFGASADLDSDGDVDGKDVAELSGSMDRIELSIFASGFGSSM